MLLAESGGEKMAALDTAKSVVDMDIPGFRLHSLKGKDNKRWSIWINGNWRLSCLH